MLNRRTVLLLAAAVFPLAACGEDPVEPADPVDQLLTDIRTTTSEYQDIGAATAAGYAPVSPCVSGPPGGMGFHYALEARIDAEIVPTEPELLLYEPQAGGGMALVGVEYMVMAPAWDAQHATPPELLGVVFDDHRAEADRHGLPFPHYDLHVWAWRDNPAGVFAPLNPDVSCDNAG